MNRIIILLKKIVRRLIVASGVEPAYVRALIKKSAEVHGGPKARRFPWPRRRHFRRAEKRAAMRIFNKEIREGSAIIYGGPEEQAYCSQFVEFMGGGYAKAVNSGTNAIYVALRSLDLEPFTEVVVPPITDPGGAMPVALLNCVPVPADTEPGSFNVSVDQIRDVVTERTSAIIIAHIAGHPVDMDPIIKLARDRSIPIIEDCAQAHGARYRGRLVGTLGDVAAFSTMYGKHHATGAQGGVVYTKNPDLYCRGKQVTDRGKPQGVFGAGGYLTASLNMNQDEISMAVGRIQLAKLNKGLAIRRRFARTVVKKVKGLGGINMDSDPEFCESVYWFLLFRLDPAKFNCTTDAFAKALEKEGIGGVSIGYPFMPTDAPWYHDRVVFGTSGMPWSSMPDPNYGRGTFPLINARAANRQCVRVDVHENLGLQEAADLVSAVKKLARYFCIEGKA